MIHGMISLKNVLEVGWPEQRPRRRIAAFEFEMATGRTGQTVYSGAMDPEEGAWMVFGGLVFLWRLEGS